MLALMALEEYRSTLRWLQARAWPRRFTSPHPPVSRQGQAKHAVLTSLPFPPIGRAAPAPHFRWGEAAPESVSTFAPNTKLSPELQPSPDSGGPGQLGSTAERSPAVADRRIIYNSVCNLTVLSLSLLVTPGACRSP